MSEDIAKIRLHVTAPLGMGQQVALEQRQAHYLFGVMRLAVGAKVALFNGRDGEWLARVEAAGKRGGTLICERQSAPQGAPPDLWLLFAPIKKARTDFIVEKATEMGAARVLPVATDFTNSERIRLDRLQAHAREAAEQTGATWVPEVAPMAKLGDVLAGWDNARRLMFCDEREATESGTLDAGGRGGPWAVLIGPEGGFSDAESARLRAQPFTVPARLGPRVLRADTAAVAALTLWQLRLGDWT